MCPGIFAVGFSRNVHIFCWAVASPLILHNFIPIGNYNLLFVLSKPTTSVLQYFAQVRKNIHQLGARGTQVPREALDWIQFQLDNIFHLLPFLRLRIPVCVFPQLSMPPVLPHLSICFSFFHVFNLILI